MNTEIFVTQLDGVIQEFAKYVSRSQHDDLSDLPEADRQALVSKAIAAVHRIAGSKSAYSQDIDRILKANPFIHQHLSLIVGVSQGLRDDLKSGFVRTLIDLAHAELFADFLEMAEHLNGSGYKDAAAVITGSALESHLRALSDKHGVKA